VRDLWRDQISGTLDALLTRSNLVSTILPIYLLRRERDMARCNRQGCQKEFDESKNAEGSCNHHPGGPVRWSLAVGVDWD